MPRFDEAENAEAEDDELNIGSPRDIQQNCLTYKIKLN